MSISTMKAVPEVEPPMSDDEAVAVIDEALEAVDEKLPPRKPGEPQEADSGEEASDEVQELVTLPGGEQVTIEDLPAKMVFEVPDGEDGETREVSGSTLIKEGLKVLQGKATYERDAQELKRQKEELYPHLQLVARMKADPEFVRHVQNYQAGIRHHDVDPELRFTDRELIQIQQADPERAARILQKRATWLEQEQASQFHQQRTQVEQARLWNEAAAHYEQQAESFIDSRHGKGSFRNEAPGVIGYLNEMGLSQQDIQGIIDPRLQAIAFDAYRYSILHSWQSNTRQSLEGKRKRLKPPKSQSAGMGGTATRQTGQKKLYRKAMKTQKADDWVKALEGRFKMD